MHDRAAMIESKLRASLAKDRSKPSRVTREGDTFTVTISGVTAGLLYALETETGVSSEVLLERLNAEDD